MKFILKSRVGYYILYILLILFFKSFLGFESAVLGGIAMIIGEIHFKQDNPEK